MNNLMRLAAWRTLSADTGAAGGAPAAPGTGSPAPATPPAEVSLQDIVSAAVAAAPDAEGADEEDDEGEFEEKETVADAEPPSPDEPLAEDSPAEDEGAIPAEIIEKYPAVKMFTDLEADLMDGEKAPETLQWFAKAIADRHGMSVAEMLGFGVEPDDESYAADWQALGFASEEEFDAAPEWEQEGYESPGELRLARQLQALEARLEPVAKDRESQEQQRAKAEAEAKWEGAIKSIAPSAIAAVKAEIGWEATPDQALAAAQQFPQMASKPGGLKEAIIAANARAIAVAAASKGKAGRPKPAEMPAGGQQPGKRIREVKDASDLPGLVGDIVASMG